MENKYTVKSEKARGATTIYWYGLKNGWYMSGTTSESREETVELLSKLCNISKEEIE